MPRELVREPALQAGVTLVGGTVERRRDRDDLAVSRMRLQAASDAAVAAGGRGLVVEAFGHRWPHLVGSGSSMFKSVVSVIASVGQESAQAPQETQVESRKPLSSPAAMFAAKPRPVAVSANAPWTSSHARTQRPHEMQSSCWNAR